MRFQIQLIGVGVALKAAPAEKASGSQGPLPVEFLDLQTPNILPASFVLPSHF